MQLALHEESTKIKKTVGRQRFSTSFMIQLVQFINYLVHNAVLNRLLGVHPVIALKVFADALNGLTGILGQDAGTHFLGTQDLLGMDLHISAYGLYMASQRGLVNHHFAVGENIALAFFTAFGSMWMMLAKMRRQAGE